MNVEGEGRVRLGWIALPAQREVGTPRNLDDIRVLCMNGVDLATGDYDNRTALHLAAATNQLGVLEYLLKDPGVMVNAVDRFGGTPLEDAIRHNRGTAKVPTLQPVPHILPPRVPPCATPEGSPAEKCRSAASPSCTCAQNKVSWRADSALLVLAG